MITLSGFHAKYRWSPPVGEGDFRQSKQHVKEICDTVGAFAAVCADNTVVTWGFAKYGGDSRGVQDQLKDVTSLHATKGAFAVLRSDGTIVAWGNPDSGGDCSKVNDQLKDVKEIRACQRAFIATRKDGTMVRWGNWDKFPLEQDQLLKITTQHAAAVVWADRTVTATGDPEFGGDTSKVCHRLRNVKNISSTYNGAFAAVLGDGGVVTWGNPEAGGNSDAVQSQLKDVKQIRSTEGAFTAMCRDGRIVTWGDASYGGDSQKVQRELQWLSWWWDMSARQKGVKRSEHSHPLPGGESKPINDTSLFAFRLRHCQLHCQILVYIACIWRLSRAPFEQFSPFLISIHFFWPIDGCWPFTRGGRRSLATFVCTSPWRTIASSTRTIAVTMRRRARRRAAMWWRHRGGVWCVNKGWYNMIVKN